MRRPRVGLAAVILLAVGVACSQPGGDDAQITDSAEPVVLVEVADAGTNSGDLVSRTWRLVAFTGHESLPADVEITAVFEAGSVAGTSGCNRYNAAFDVTGAGLEIGPIIGTRMACPEPAASVETEYLGILGDAELFLIESGQLTIRDRSGAVLTYEEAAPE